MRRYTVPAPSTVRIAGNVAKKDTTVHGNNTGIIGRIFVDGVEKFSQYIAGTDGVGVDFAFDVPVKSGSVIDFAIDPAGSADFDTTRFTATVVPVPAPAGMTVDPQTGRIQWTPGGEQVGTHHVVLEVSDGRGGAAYQDYTVSVQPASTNHRPLIVSGPVTRAVVGQPYAYHVSALDPDGDPIEYRLTSGPPDMTIDSGSGLIRWEMPRVGLQFDGVNDYLLTPNLRDEFTDESVTIELWFKPEAAGVIVAEIGQPAVNSGWHDSQLEILATGEVKARVWNLSPVSLGHVSFGTWHHVALRYDKTAAQLDGFLDGVASSVVSGDRAAPWESGYGLYYAFGATDTTNMGSGAYFQGMLHDVRVWNRARTTQEIVADLGRMVAGTEAGLVANWRLVEGSGSIASDRTPHGWQASLGGGVLGAQPTWPTPNVIVVEATDSGSALDTQTFTVTVFDPIPNASSTITSTAPVQAAVERPYAYQVTAVDIDGDPLRFELTDFPTGMALDTITGQITWTPTIAQLGSHVVTVIVTDSRSGTDAQSFTIEVVETRDNHAPQITSTPPDVAATGQLYRYTAVAVDPDADLLQFDLPVRPTGMAMDPFSGIVAWTPAPDQVGSHDVVLRVRDGQGGVDLQALRIEVTAANTPPVITSTPQLLATAGQPYRYLVRSQDADGDALSYTLLKGPAGMTVDSATGMLAWTSPLGSALNFDGDDYVPTELQIDQSESSTGVTMEAWVRPVDTHDSGHYYVIGTDNAGYDWSLYRAGDRWQVLSGEGLRDTGLSVDFDTWQHVAAVFQPGLGVRFYKNGQEAVVPYIGYDSSDNPIAIGTNPGFGGRFQGSIDEVRVWNTVRSGAEIRGSMNRGLAGDEPGLMGYWRFDEGTGTTAYDSSAQDNHGMLGGGNPANEPIWISSFAPIPGTSEVMIRVEDGRGGFDTQTYGLQVALDIPNDPPLITSQPRKTMRLGDTYFYQVQASDPNADPLTYSFENAPLGMVIDSAGLIQWAPSEAQLGPQLVTIRVDDGRGGFITQTFTLKVLTDDTNQAPRIVSAPPMKATVDGLYRYDALAVDPEADPILWSLVTAPQGLSLDGTAGTIRWTPSLDQLGTQQVTLRATDALGASATQTFEIMVRNINVPPTITSSPPTRVNAGDVYVYAVRASDPDDDPLQFVLQAGPTAMVLDKATGLMRWRPRASDEGQHLIELSVDDGHGGRATQSYAVEVVVAPPNRAPVITSTPTFEARAQAPYVYIVTATDADGEQPRFELSDRPNGMAIDPATGVIQWTPLAAHIGLHTVTVVAIDAAGAGSMQSYRLSVRQANQAPEIISFPELAVTAGTVYRYDARAQDPDGDPVRYSLLAAPQGMVVDELGRVAWSPSEGDLGAHHVELAAVDDLGASDKQSFDLTVFADQNPPRVSMRMSQNPAAVGQTIDVVVLATDDVGVESILLTVAGTPVPLDINGRAVLAAEQVGSFEIVASAVDAAGNEGEATATLTVIDPSVVGDPLVALVRPTTDGVITGPIAVIGTADDPDLLYYTLSVAPFGTTMFREIGHGTSSVIGSALGTFDPSLLSNDSYVLRLYAMDAGGNDASTEMIVSVAGDLKLGNFTLAFTDMSIPVSGIPLNVTRTYDTLQANESGDLGYGWSLAFRDTRLRTNVPRSGLEDAGIYSAFRYGTRVYLTVPGGRREGFTFRPQAEDFLGLTLYYPAFVPDRGVTSRLTVPDVALQPKPDGFHEFGMGGPAYNPADPMFGGTYTLTTQEGTAYEVDGQSGQLLTITDRNQNTLTFHEEGIESSTGKRIAFERDAWGRIEAVVDPLGNRVVYRYDARGDLVSVTDREGNTTQFVYRTDAHYLERVIDPLGRTGVRSVYDANGRLERLYDAQGNAVVLIHDVEHSLETVLDALGNPTSYQYDSQGNIVTEVDAMGGVIHRTYDAENNMRTETDPLGRQTIYEYDARGNVTSKTDPLGNTTRRSYDDFGNVLTETNALGQTTRKQYDSRGNFLSATDPSGIVTQFSYDASGHLLSITEPGGGRSQFSYNSQGEMTSQTDPLGHEITYTYDGNGRRVTENQVMTTPAGPRTLTTFWQYDTQGRVLAVTDAEGNTTRSEYDELGQRIASIDAMGRRTQYVFDDRGLEIERILPDATPADSTDNPRLRTEYDLAGREVAQIDEMGRRTQFVYDPMGRLITTIYPDSTPANDADNPRSVNQYDAAGQLVVQIDELGHRTEFGYDAAGRSILVRDAMGNESITVYCATGCVSSETDAMGHTTSYGYDDGGRRVETLFADGNKVFKQYDNAGRTAMLTDQAGRVTAYQYDALGRLTAVVDALSQRTEYGYDELGNLVVLTDANQHSTTFEYDALGHRTATILPLGQRSETVYDSVGNIVATIDFNGNVIQYHYDERDRLLSKEYPDSSGVEYTYTLNGLRETVTDSRGVTRYQYDERDRLVVRSDPDGRQLTYTYDAAGNGTSLTIPSGTTTYEYDALNRLTAVTDPGQAVTQYHYDALSRLVQTDLPNGMIETRQYDALGRLTYMQHMGQTGTVASYLFELDTTGNRTSVTEHDGRFVKYTYDELYRLIGESISDPVSGSRTVDYAYDPVGNRLSRNDSLEGLTLYTYDGNDRLLIDSLATEATRYEYDGNGNTVRLRNAVDKVLSEWTWDYENRLVGADTDGDGTTDVEYQYDADGLRVLQKVAGEETRFLVDTNRPYAEVVEEYTPGGVIRVSYVHGLDLISQNRTSDGINYDKMFYHVDGLGSTRALTDGDGEVVQRYDYDAFGRLTGQIGSADNVYMFGGEPRDSVTGLDYLRARYLDTSTGRFASVDPFPAAFTLPATLHRYAYTFNNPVNATDPSGKSSVGEVMVSVAIGAILRAISVGLSGGVLLGAAAVVRSQILEPAYKAQYLAVNELSHGINVEQNMQIIARSRQYISFAYQMLAATGDLLSVYEIGVGLTAALGTAAFRSVKAITVRPGRGTGQEMSKASQVRAQARRLGTRLERQSVKLYELQKKAARNPQERTLLVKDYTVIFHDVVNISDDISSLTISLCGNSPGMFICRWTD
ncbi:MAG: putative Ig domain-containing protein [Pirellulaceae bacterium]